MAIRNTALGGIDYQDTGSTLLDGSITDSDTTVTVDSTASFKSGGGTFRVGTELIDYTGVTATTFTGCTRGQYGTTAAAHADNAAVTEEEVVKAVDMNDTYDALTNTIRSLSVFWLNDELYDVYDDFDSYSVGAITTNTNWTFSTAGGGTTTIASSTIAGGSGKELLLFAKPSGTTTGEAEAVTKLLADDKHKQLKYAIFVDDNAGGDLNSTVTVQIKIGSQSYTNIYRFSATNDIISNSQVFNGDILVIAKGSNVYDVYAGGRKVFDNVTEADPQLGLKVTTSGNTSFSHLDVTMYVDDVVESKGTI